MKCSICGFENTENSKFCSECGSPIKNGEFENTDFRNSTIPMRAITDDDLNKNNLENNEDYIEDEYIDETENEYISEEDYIDEFVEDEYEEDDEIEILNTKTGKTNIQEKKHIKNIKNKVFIGVSLISVILVIFVVSFATSFKEPLNKFKRAFEAKKYDEAIEIYSNAKDKENWDEVKNSYKSYIENESKDIIKSYSKDKINTAQADEVLKYIKQFDGLIDYKKISEEYDSLKADKENYKLAKDYISKDEYIKAMRSLQSISDNSKDKDKRDELISSIEYKYKDEVISKSNELVKESKYDEAIEILDEASKYYRLDSEISKQLYEVKREKEDFERENKEKEENEKKSILESFNKFIDKVTGAVSYKPNGYKEKFNIPFRGEAVMPYIDGEIGNNTLRFVVGINRFKEFNISEIIAVTNNGEENLFFNLDDKYKDSNWISTNEWVDIAISKSNNKDFDEINILQSLAESNNSKIIIKGKNNSVEYKLSDDDKMNIVNAIKLHNMGS